MAIKKKGGGAHKLSNDNKNRQFHERRLFQFDLSKSHMLNAFNFKFIQRMFRHTIYCILYLLYSMQTVALHLP